MEKITNKSLYDLKSVSQPVVVGDYAFYVETEMLEDGNKYVSSIYRVDVNTQERTFFGDSGSVNIQVKISPNEKWLTYLSNSTKDEKVQVFAIPLTGGSATQLTFEENGVSNYLWVKDSASLYYQTSVKDKVTERDTAEDFEKSKESKEPKMKKDQVSKKVFTKLQYKMDGRGELPEDLLYQIKKLPLLDLNEAVEPELIVEENRSLGLSYVAKDESYILYFDRFDPEDEWIYGGTMYKYDVATKEAKIITEQIPKGMFGFSLANEAEDYFLFTGNDFGYKFVTNSHIYGYDLTNDTLTDLISDLDFSVGDSLVGDFQQNTGGPAVWWLEDGESFLFKTTEHGKITLYQGNTKGEYEKVLDDNIHITGLDLLADQTQAVVTYSTPTNPSAIARLNLETGRLAELYNPNENFLAMHTVAEPERFWYQGVSDWQVQGWYLPPIETAANHPAILYIHGGPQVSYGETFFHEMQALASAGYGVIMLNPRGGSGYGQEFVAAILDNYGDEDYQDLLIGTDYVLANHPEIDAERLYVAGGSYGGFMTNWMVTHTNRFRAAVTQRSISNWISFYGTSDIGPSFVEFQLGRDLSQADELWQMSPLAHTANAQTPLLVLHGEQDLRCPQEQGEQMYIAMKKQGVETRFVTFPQSSHGLSREGLPNLRQERLNEIVDWFEKYK